VTVNYGKLAASALESDPAALKKSVNLAAVVMADGVTLEDNGSGRLVGSCPFHSPDDNPSFSVWRWEDGTWATGCWSCSFSTTDIFGYIEERDGVGFGTAVKIAVAIRDGVPLPDIVAPVGRVGGGGPRNFSRIAEEARRECDMALIEQLLTDRGIDVPATWVCEEFGVGTLAGEVMIPHLGDPGGGVAAVQKRTPPDWSKRCLAGSQLRELYGVNRAFHRTKVDGRWASIIDDTREVVLCEGASDTWSVAYLLRDEPVDVVGLPSGAAAGLQPSWRIFMRDRRVTLLFDADDAGRAAAERWATALSGVAADVRVAALPDGEDATSAGPEAVRSALTESTRSKTKRETT